MTTITLPRALIEQALEVINDTAYGAPVFRQEVRDTITTLRAALAQPDPQDPELSAALGWPGGISDPVLDRKVLLQQVAALRAALAQQAEPVQDQRCRAEPRSDGDFVCDCKIGECPGRSAEPAQEPVAWECKAGGLKPLTQRQYDAQTAATKRHYTRIAPPQRQPLTDATLWGMWVDSPSDVLRFARAVERAHGIKE